MLHDPRQVHQYMDRVLKILLDVVRRNGCTVIHASHSKAGLDIWTWRSCNCKASRVEGPQRPKPDVNLRPEESPAPSPASSISQALELL